MTQLTWGDQGSRLYEAGVDRGVLFIGSNTGVPWNGLTAITEKPSGAAATASYFDGVRYLTAFSGEEYAATLEAFYSPVEFDQCDGSMSLNPLVGGFSAQHQPRQPFGLTYRTKLGNDIDGTNYGYKIHFVYNCYALPSQKAYKTLDAAADIDTLSWDLVANPIIGVTGTGVDGTIVAAPTAHFVIDTSTASESEVAAVEQILYGSPTTESRLPLPAEIISIMAADQFIFIEDNGDGTFTATSNAVIDNGDGTYSMADPDLVDNGDGTFSVYSE